MRLVQIGLILALAGLMACSKQGLRDLRPPSDGPDEFLIVPGKPLEAPEDFSALPAPTPEGSNRTDLLPLEESVAALGGRRSAATGSIPGSDGTIVNYTSRFGRDGAIRQTLATEDEAYRKRRGRFIRFRLARVDRYKLLYERQALDAKREHARWRRAGARTPSAPPSN